MPRMIEGLQQWVDAGLFDPDAPDPNRFADVLAFYTSVGIEAEDFVGVPFDEACLLEDRTDRPVLTASAYQVRQKISPRSVGRWKRYAAHLRPLADALGDLLPAEDRAFIDAA